METCIFCQGVMDPTTHRCRQCGRNQSGASSAPTRPCPHCGTALPPTARFCTTCGNAVSPQVAVPEDAAQRAVGGQGSVRAPRMPGGSQSGAPHVPLVPSSPQAWEQPTHQMFPPQGRSHLPAQSAPPHMPGYSPPRAARTGLLATTRAKVIAVVLALIVVLVGGGLAYVGLAYHPSTSTTKTSKSTATHAPTGSTPGATNTSGSTGSAQGVIFQGHTNSVLAVAWSPDGQFLASASADKTVRVWSLATRNMVYTYTGHTDAVNIVAWSPDSKRIASGSNDGTVQVWNATSGQNVVKYQSKSGSVLALAWSPDGKDIVSGNGEIWDATTGQVVFTFPGLSEVESLAWSPDDKRIAAGSGQFLVLVWDALTGANPLTYKGTVGEVAALGWSPDSKRIASAGAAGSSDNNVRIWDATTGTTLLTYKPPQPAPPYSLSWSPDGKYIASGAGMKVLVWDTALGATLFTYTGHTAYVKAVAWSPDGKHIASGSADQTVQVWVVGV